MKISAVFFLAGFLAYSALGSPPESPPPRSPYHLLLGPYEFDEHGERLPRYFLLDGKAYQNIDALKATLASLPTETTVYLRGSCSPYDAIDLPPHATSLSDLREYCRLRKVTFTWTFGAGGY